MKWLAIGVSIFIVLLIGMVVYLGGTPAENDDINGVRVSVEEGVVELRNKQENGNPWTMLAEGGETEIDAQGEMETTWRKGSGGRDSQGIGSSTSEVAANSNVDNASKIEYWISGFVYNATREPLADVPVSAVYLPEDLRMNSGLMFKDESLAMGSKFVGDMEPVTASTNEDGYYAIELQRAGNYNLISNPSINYLSSNKIVKLTQKESAKTEDFILEYAPYTFTGKVIDKETKEPIAGAEVQLMPWSDTRNQTPTQKTVREETNQNGEFDLERLARGKFIVTVKADGYVKYSPRWTEEKNDPLYEVEIGEEKHENLVIEMEPGYAVKITVLDPDQKPLSDAEINILSTKREGDVQNFKTDPNGVCTIDVLPQVAAAALVRRKPFGETVSEAFEPGEKESPTEITVVMNEAAKISGCVRKEDGEAVPGRKMYATFQKQNKVLNGYTYGISGLSAETDEYGNYVFENCGTGNYIVEVMAETNDEGSSYGSGMKKTVETNAGEETANVDFILKKIDLSESVKGRVVNTDGEPLPGLRVFVHVNNPINVSNSMGHYNEDYTDENGEFFVDKLTKGNKYAVLVSADGYQDYHEYFYSTEKYVEVVLKSSFTIKGIVRDLETQQPISKAAVTKGDIYGRYYTAYTGEDGRFEFTGQKGGHYEIQAEAEDYASSDEIRIFLDDSAEEHIKNVSIDLDGGVQIQGIVLNQQQEPVPGASVALMSKIRNANVNQFGTWEPLTFTNKVQSDNAGNFTLTHVPRQGDVIMVKHPNYAMRKYQLTPERMSMDLVVIEINKGGTIVGTVLDEEGKPEIGTSINVFNYPRNEFTMETQTNEQGDYRLELIPSDYVTVRKGQSYYGRSHNHKQVKVVEGETVRVDFGTGEGARVYGTVYADDSVASRYLVSISPDMVGSERFQLTAMTDNQGNYEIIGVPPGSFRAMAFSDSGESYLSFPHADGITSFQVGKEDRKLKVDIYAKTYKVEGTILDEESGNPLSNVQIMPHFNKNADSLKTFLARTRTDENGVFFLNLRQHGEYQLSAFKEGYEYKNFSFIVPHDLAEPYTLDLNLKPSSCSLMIQLIFNNTPIKMDYPFHVGMHQNGTFHFIEAEPHDELPGRYELHGLAEGNIDLMVQGFQSGRLLYSIQPDIPIKPGQPAMVLCELQEMILCIIRLEPEDGAVLSGDFDIQFPTLPQMNLLPTIWPMNMNTIEIGCPMGNHPVIIKVPGYKAKEFIPEEVMFDSPGSNAYNITLSLEKE